MISVIGIDCATAPGKVGLARGEVNGSSLVILEARKVKKQESVKEVICSWILPSVPTLLAIDAPLGWPNALGMALARHNAGMPIECDANSLFRRETDRYIKGVIGKQPLDVGADRIARTAHAALSLIEEIRQKTGQPVSMAWETELQPGIWAIEVYPAATLTVWGMRSSVYKSPEHTAERREILKELGRLARIDCDEVALEQDDDVLDAAICVLAGADFLTGRAMPPENMEVARKEGWIWVRSPQ